MREKSDPILTKLVEAVRPLIDEGKVLGAGGLISFESKSGRRANFYGGEIKNLDLLKERTVAVGSVCAGNIGEPELFYRLGSSRVSFDVGLSLRVPSGGEERRIGVLPKVMGISEGRPTVVLTIDLGHSTERGIKFDDRLDIRSFIESSIRSKPSVKESALLPL